ncbi:MAG: hypothetical protein ACYDCN_01305 [Bacteroidia bacterium]
MPPIHLSPALSEGKGVSATSPFLRKGFRIGREGSFSPSGRRKRGGEL